MALAIGGFEMTTLDVAPKNFLTSGEMAKFLAAARQGKHGIRDYLLGLMAYRHGLRVSELIRVRLDDLDLDSGRIFVRRAKGSMSTNHPMQGDEVRAVRAWLRERKHFLPVPVLAYAGTEERYNSLTAEARESTTSQLVRDSNDDSRGGQDISRRGYSDGNSSGGSEEPSSSTPSSTLNGEATSRPDAHVEVKADSSPFLFLNEKHRAFARQAINYLFAEIGKRAGLGHVHPHMLRHACGFTLANAGCDTRLIQDFLGHRDIHNTERYTRTSAHRFEGLWK
jgi:site-specific recombinase XerD